MIIELQTDNYWQLKWLDKFLIGHKGAICGGCFKNIFNKEKVKDLDIFFRSKQDFDNAVKYFDENSAGYTDSEGNKLDKSNAEFRSYYENKNVKAYKHLRTGVTIELCCKIFGTPEEIINQFDFTITKFAYYNEEVKKDDEDESSLVTKCICHLNFFEHLHLKRLVLDDKILYPMSTFERVLRYAKYGYSPCKETKIKLAEAIHKLPEEQLSVSNNLYDGID